MVSNAVALICWDSAAWPSARPFTVTGKIVQLSGPWVFASKIICSLIFFRMRMTWPMPWSGLRFNRSWRSSNLRRSSPHRQHLPQRSTPLSQSWRPVLRLLLPRRVLGARLVAYHQAPPLWRSGLGIQPIRRHKGLPLQPTEKSQRRGASSADPRQRRARVRTPPV